MTVTLPYDSQWGALAWARENCPSYITNTTDPASLMTVKQCYSNGTGVRIVYHFGDEKDVLMFMLRWA